MRAWGKAPFVFSQVRVCQRNASALRAGPSCFPPKMRGGPLCAPSPPVPVAGDSTHEAQFPVASCQLPVVSCQFSVASCKWQWREVFFHERAACLLVCSRYFFMPRAACCTAAVSRAR